MSRGVYVDGLTEHNITSARDAYQVTSNYPAATLLMLTQSHFCTTKGPKYVAMQELHFCKSSQKAASQFWRNTVW
jgi:hypothetical protein